MKKLISIVAIVATIFIGAIAIGSLTTTPSLGFNKQLIDLNYDFDYAIVQRYDGEQKIKIKSWTDYENGEQIQIIDTDGNVWLLNSVYTILVKEAK